MYKISKLVSPYDASEYYNFRHDGDVSDTFKELWLLYDNGMSINNIISRMNKDEFYKDIINRIIEDITNK